MKTYRVEVTARAKSDLQRIKAYIIRTTGLSKTAERTIRDLAQKLRDFQTLPHKGTQRGDIREALRLLPHRKAVIAFEIDDETSLVRVLRLFYAGEDIEAFFTTMDDTE